MKPKRDSLAVPTDRVTFMKVQDKKLPIPEIDITMLDDLDIENRNSARWVPDLMMHKNSPVH